MVNTLPGDAFAFVCTAYRDGKEVFLFRFLGCSFISLQSGNIYKYHTYITMVVCKQEIKCSTINNDVKQLWALIVEGRICFILHCLRATEFKSAHKHDTARE